MTLNKQTNASRWRFSSYTAGWVVIVLLSMGAVLGPFAIALHTGNHIEPSIFGLFAITAYFAYMALKAERDSRPSMLFFVAAIAIPVLSVIITLAMNGSAGG